MKTSLTTSVALIILSFATFTNSSLATPPLQPPQNYTGELTHGDFISCAGVLLPPVYGVDGTWVLNIDKMTQPQVAPTAHLTMVVFRDGVHYLLFPHIELTPVSLANGVYTYSYGAQVTVTLDTNTSPVTFSWHVEFADNCTLRSYRSLSYIGTAHGRN
jgi:hypothetical protein